MDEQHFNELTEELRAFRRKPLFFIVGCQRSGNTWLQHLLDGHPEVCCVGETLFVPRLLPTIDAALQHYHKQQTAGRRNQFEGTDLEYLFTTMVLLLMKKWEGSDEAKCIGEKSPEHALYMEALHTTFPHAKYVHIIRDGRDVVVSGWFHNLHTPSAAFTQALAGDFGAYVEHSCRCYWVPYVSSAQTFGQQHPKLYHELRYEQLHADPEATIARLLRFLDVDASPGAVGACLEAGAFERRSQGRPRGTEDRQAFYRKGIVGDWRNHFDGAATATFKQHAGALLAELGYGWEGS